MGPIFNEKIVKKWDLWVLWIVYGTHWCAYFAVNSDRLKSQKKKKKQTNADANSGKIIWIQTAPNFNTYKGRGESLKKTDSDVYPNVESKGVWTPHVGDENLRGCVIL